MKIVFMPFGVIGGLIAGAVGKRLFEGLWALIAKEEPPEPSQRDVPWAKVIAALLLEGAIFRVVRGIVDRAARFGFSKATGTWPGEEHPEAA